MDFYKKCLLWSVLILLTAVLFTSTPASQAAPAQAAVDWRFGVIESYENPGAASALGVGWTRVKFHWAATQSGGPGTWTPNVTEAQINNEIAAGRTVVGLLIGVPDWAWENGLPRGLHLPHNDPGNTWGTYVREAVTRYNGRINHWIIWNEPDIGDPNAPGFTWPGSVNDFFQLQRTAYLVAKEVNPNATIHLPAFTHFWDPNYIYNFLDVVVADPSAPGNNYYFDAITAHLYFQPDTVFNIIQSFYGAVGSRGIPWKPVWLVETNAPPIDDPVWPVSNYTFVVSQQEQAAYIPQALASALAAGAQRIAIYKLQDTEGDVAANPEPFGLLRMDGSRRPAYSTYQIGIQYLAGMQGVKRTRWDAVGQIQLEQAGKTTTVLFSRLPAPQQATVEATSSTAVLVDMWGSRQSISAQDGVFTIELPGAICGQTAGDYCMIGGATYYLVQATDGGGVPGAPGAPAPPAAESPEPEETPVETQTPEPTDTAVPTDEPTATSTSTSTEKPTATQTAVPTQPPTDTPTSQPTPPPSSQATTEIAARPSTPEPTIESATSSSSGQANDRQSSEPTNNFSIWLIGTGGILALLMGGAWLRQRTA